MVKQDEQKNELPELLTLKEACALLKVHENTLRQWDAKGILPAVRIGEKKLRRYKKEDIMKFLSKKTWTNFLTTFA